MLTTDRLRAHVRHKAALLIFALLSASQLGAQVPDGGTVQLNSLPWEIALNNGKQATAVDRRGNVIHVWQSYGPAGSPDGDGLAVVGRRFDRFGDPLGPEFLINSYTTGNQERPEVAFDSRGRFVVTWASGTAVFGQRFESSGAQIGAEFTVTQSTWSFLAEHSLAVAPSGAFVVAWEGPDGHSIGVMARRFDQNGSPLGSEFQVNTETFSQQQHSAIAFTDGDESFVVVYESIDGSSSGISGQAFSAAGDRVGAEFVANTSTLRSEVTPAVASDGNGGFVVVWSADSPFDPLGGGIVGRRFAAPDQPLGADFRINESTTVYQVAPSVAAGENGEFVVSYTSAGYFPDGRGGDVFARRLEPSGAPRGAEFQVSTTWAGNNYPSNVASDPHGNFIVSWRFIGNVYARWFGGLLPEAVDVDTTPTASSDGNGILEPGETVSIVPSWTNGNASPQTFAGIAWTFTGPAGATYTLADGAANYGPVASAATVSCADTADCYSVAVSAPSPRPAPHWDAMLREDIVPDAQGQSRNWRLHVGASFADVPRADPFYRYVETLLHAGLTSGCSATAYCPDSATTREQMAVFVLLAREGARYAPPACSTPVFADLPASSPFCPFIEELARRGVVGGCGGGLYCPTAAVSREQMAAFVLRTLDPALVPAACVAGSEAFADVPASSPFCPWIEELARRGVVSGCGGGNYCPASDVTREQMSVFLTVTFGLTLYGP